MVKFELVEDTEYVLRLSEELLATDSDVGFEMCLSDDKDPVIEAGILEIGMGPLPIFIPYGFLEAYTLVGSDDSVVPLVSPEFTPAGKACVLPKSPLVCAIGTELENKVEDFVSVVAGEKRLLVRVCLIGGAAELLGPKEN